MKLDEALAYLGIVVFTAGLGFIYWPTALLFVGAVLVAAAVLWVD